MAPGIKAATLRTVLPIVDLPCKPAAFDSRYLPEALHRRPSLACGVDPLYEAGHTTSLLAARSPVSVCPGDRRGLVKASRGCVLVICSRP